MTADGFGDVDDGLDAAVCGPEIPSFEEEFGHVGGLGIEILEHQADLVSPGGFQMTASEVEGLQLLFLVGGEVVGILEPEIAGAPESSGWSLRSRRRTSSTASLTRLTTWNLSKVRAALGRCSATPLMKALDMSALTSV